MTIIQIKNHLRAAAAATPLLCGTTTTTAAVEESFEDANDATPTTAAATTTTAAAAADCHGIPLDAGDNHTKDPVDWDNDNNGNDWDDDMANLFLHLSPLDDDDDDGNNCRSMIEPYSSLPCHPSYLPQEAPQIPSTTRSSSNNNNNTTTATPPPTTYTSRKPTWWKRRSGRQASKGQKRIVAALHERYTLSKPPYGTVLSWDAVFSTCPPLANATTTPPPPAAENQTIDAQQQQPIEPQQPPQQPKLVQQVVPTTMPRQRPVWLEIGFGLGDNLLCLAAAAAAANNQPPFHTNINGTNKRTDSLTKNDKDKDDAWCFVGAEIHPAGIGTLYRRIATALSSDAPWKEYTLFNTDTDSTTIATTILENHTDHDKNRTNNNSSDSSSSSSTMNEAILSADSFVESQQHINNNSIDDDLRLYHNLRIYAGDGTKLLPNIPDASVAVVLIAFPDPFMASSREEHWRLLQLPVLIELRRILHGRLYLATDHEGYFEWSLSQIETFNRTCINITNSGGVTNSGGDDAVGDSDEDPVVAKRQRRKLLFTLVEPTPDRTLWLPVVSKYEQKGINEGRRTRLACWE